jgi:DNA-binding ferritin-like protein (Dps family)
MAPKWIEVLTGSLEQKRQWRAYKARVARFPSPYRESVDAIERYLMYAGGSDTESMLTMLDDLADLFERAAADGTPVRDIVGDDAVEFVETFKSNYGVGAWIAKEQKRLLDAIGQAEKEQS